MHNIVDNMLCAEAERTTRKAIRECRLCQGNYLQYVNIIACFYQLK